MAYRETANVKARKAAQRDHLLVCAEQLVREGGFANLTMQTLAAKAGPINKSMSLSDYCESVSSLLTQYFEPEMFASTNKPVVLS